MCWCLVPSGCFLDVSCVWQWAARSQAHLAEPCLSRTLNHRPSCSWDSDNISFAWARQFSRPSCLSNCLIAFADAWAPYIRAVPSATHHHQGHDMTSFCWLVVMGSKRFASPIKGSFCGGLYAYCMQTKPLFLRTSGSSGVLKAFLLDRNGQLS